MKRLARSVTRAGITISLAVGLTAAAAQVSAASSHHRRHHRHVVTAISFSGTVSAVGTSGFTLTTAQGGTKTIGTSPSTIYQEPGTRVVPSGVAVGERVVVRLTTSSSLTTPVAASVRIELERVSGTVTSVTGSTITVLGSTGLSTDVLVSSTTTYSERGTVVSESTVTTGAFVTAFGVPDPTDAYELVAMVVDVTPPPPPPKVSTAKYKTYELRGTVTAVGTGTFTVQTADQGPVVVHTTTSTTYEAPGTHPTPSGVVAGDDVLVRLVPGTSTPTARSVLIELVHLSGTVQSVTGSTIAILGDDGLLTNVVVTATTVYDQNGAAATQSAVVPGVAVRVIGLPSASDPYDLDAVTISISPVGASPETAGHNLAQLENHSAQSQSHGQVRPAKQGEPQTDASGLKGIVRSISGDAVVVSGLGHSGSESGHSGTTVTVVVTSTTTVRDAAGVVPSTAVAVGDRILALGSFSANGDFVATQVVIQTKATNAGTAALPVNVGGTRDDDAATSSAGSGAGPHVDVVQNVPSQDTPGNHSVDGPALSGVQGGRAAGQSADTTANTLAGTKPAGQGAGAGSQGPSGVSYGANGGGTQGHGGQAAGASAGSGR